MKRALSKAMVLCYEQAARQQCYFFFIFVAFVSQKLILSPVTSRSNAKNLGVLAKYPLFYDVAILYSSLSSLW